MFARFRLSEGEINVNASQVTSFEPGEEKGTSVLNFLNGEVRNIPFSNQAVRHAFKKAMANSAASQNEEANQEEEA